MSSSSSAAASKRAKKKKTSGTNSSSKKQPVRVLVRCSWSGARHPVPSPLPSTGQPVTTASRLSDIVEALRPALPPTVFDGESTVLYLRKCVGRGEWATTKLRDLGVGQEDGGGGGGGAGVLLTLNLPGVAVATASGGANTVGGAVAAATSAGASAAAAAAVATKPPPPPASTLAPPPPAAASSSPCVVPTTEDPTPPQPMDIDSSTLTTTAATAPRRQIDSVMTSLTSPFEALELLLNSNFDSDSRDAVQTLLKILDNVLSKPGDTKVRTIRLTNPAIQRKVVARKGAVDFLLGVGFAPQKPAIPLFSGSIGGIGGSSVSQQEEEETAAEFLELTEENEDLGKILEARKLLATKAVHVLGMNASDIPELQTLPPPPPIGTTSSSGGAASASEFDPYKAHSYNTQSAATGAADPHSVTPGSDGQYVSKTEKQLDALKAKQSRLEKKMQKLGDRGLVATRPGQVSGSPISTVSAGEDDFGSSSSGGKGDGGLLAAHMKGKEEERRKREEGGFTTQAMRDLERMKKAKVYSHATLKVSFPDGCALTAKFLPNEMVKDVREVIREALLVDLRGDLKFELYVTPPRRLLDDDKTLDEEGLVPAAKVYVSWKGLGGVNPGPPAGWEAGAYLRPELFADLPPKEAFPDAQKVAGGGTKKSSGAIGKGGGNGQKGKGEGGGDPKASREEELMKRMMGGTKGLLGKLGGGLGKKGGGGKKKKDGDGKWV